MSEQQQAQFNGWAKVEVMGHQTHIGYVRTEAYGQAVMFRIDQPEFPARQYVLDKPAFADGKWTPAGATVERPAILGCSVMVGAGSIYRIVPCTEEAARRAIESEMRSELKLIELPVNLRLAAVAAESYDESGQDDEEEDDE